MRLRTPFSNAALGPRISDSPPWRRLAPLLAPAFLAAALGCGENAQSPTTPEPGPALAAGATIQTLSFRQVSTGGGFGGDLHTCGVTTDDRAYCWGATCGGSWASVPARGRRTAGIRVAPGRSRSWEVFASGT